VYRQSAALAEPFAEPPGGLRQLAFRAILAQGQADDQRFRAPFRQQAFDGRPVGDIAVALQHGQWARGPGNPLAGGHPDSLQPEVEGQQHTA
jgi:hypothetical protein